MRFSQTLASHLQNQEAGDIVFAFRESTQIGDSLDAAPDASPHYKYLYAWKQCLIAGNDDCYFAKRHISTIKSLTNRIHFQLGSGHSNA